MIKKILIWWFGFFVTLALVVVFMPLVYAMTLALIVFLPPIILIASFFEKRDAYRIHNLKEAFTNLFLAVVVLPMALLALVASIRAILLAALSYFPAQLAKFNDIHQPFYDLFIPVFGQLFPYWLDLQLGIYGLLIIFIAAVLDSIRRNMLVSQIEILPTSTVQSAAIGLVELKGKAIPFNGKKNSPVIRSWVDSSGDGHSTRTEANPFYLDDGSGRVLIDPRECHISSDSSYFEIKLHHAVLKSFKPETGFWESRLMPGDDVYVLGNLQILDDETDKKSFPDESVIIKPLGSSLLRSNFYDLFFISNTTEEELLRLFKKSIHRGWLKIVVLMAISGWLSIYAWSNINQLNNMDIEAAPVLFRILSTPTTLEQRYEIDELGKKSTLEWLKLVEQGHEHSHDILLALQKQGRQKLAIPILLKQARDIDHANFAVASAWLGKLKAVPPGHWAAMYFGKEYEDRKESLVLRVLLDRRDGGLFASYRAKFDRKKASKFELLRRYVVFELTNKETGIVKTRKLVAKEGWNAVDDVEVFEYFLPGEYSFDMYAASEYRGGAKDRGSRQRKAFDVSLY